ncbi:Hypothetical predicted protein [Olea europaea subsp. europaea]|uniref:Uncharacterized protein n=1 Tax=Olea europaea subsp. europaea TaxID=158383 RepID=A0A8S0PFD7_OLEEU|nr:Hypothetical predicted protein [Olea europaea subsp. europaea]
MALVAHFLYCKEVDWPLNSSRFLYNELTPELLHIIFCTNIYPTSQRMKFNEERARLSYHMARVHKFDLGAHINAFIRELASSIDTQRSIMFSCLTNGLCLTARVPLLPREESVALEVTINRRKIEKSKARLKGTERVHHLELGPNEPQQVPDADIVLLSRQLS